MLDAGLVTIIAQRLGLKVWDSFIERACCEKKTVYLNGGWRGGKSNTGAFMVFLALYLIWLNTPIPRTEKGAPLGSHLIWLVAPQYEQAHEEFRYLLQWMQRLGLNVQAFTPGSGSWHMTVQRDGHPGIVEIITKSSDDPTNLGSVAPVIILACECGLMSEEVKEWVEGRISEKNATVIWSGTFHNDSGKQQYAWYETVSADVVANPTPRIEAFNLPSWENEHLFGNCLDGPNGITADRTLEVWCPDANHGSAHSGLEHPMMRMRKAQYADRPREWAKRYGGVPTGVLNPVYEWATTNPDHYLRPMPPELKHLRSAGGMDFGTVHPSAITLGSVMANGETWVWRSVKDTSGSLDWIWATKAALTRQHNVRLWGADPMVKYNPTFLDAQAMSGSLYAREARVGIVNGVVLDDKLFFDSTDPGVVLLFREMQRVHRRRNANGQVAYVREEDDMTASFEDMIAMLHGQPVLHIPKRWRLPALKPVGAR